MLKMRELEPLEPLAESLVELAGSEAFTRDAARLLTSRNIPPQIAQPSDATQEAIARTLRSGNSDITNVAHYAYRTLANVVTSMQRRQIVARLRSGSPLPMDEQRVEAPCEQDGIEQAENRIVLMDALQCLPARQREALFLSYFCDMSVAQVAEAMGITPGTVKSLSFAGMGKLRQIIPGDVRS